jgi:hypothetical protein
LAVFGLFWLSGVALASRLVSEGLILGLAETCLVSLDYGAGYFFAFYWACL